MRRTAGPSPSVIEPAGAAGAEASSWPLIVIGDMVSGDWPSVQAIHQQGLDTGDASFDVEASSWEAWDRGHLPAPRLVARDDDDVVGWAALSPVQRKSAYRGLAEASVYVAAKARGGGVARMLGER